MGRITTIFVSCSQSEKETVLQLVDDYLADQDRHPSKMIHRMPHMFVIEDKNLFAREIFNLLRKTDWLDPEQVQVTLAEDQGSGADLGPVSVPLFSRPGQPDQCAELLRAFGWLEMPEGPSHVKVDRWGEWVIDKQPDRR